MQKEFVLQGADFAWGAIAAFVVLVFAVRMFSRPKMDDAFYFMAGIALVALGSGVIGRTVWVIYRQILFADGFPAADAYLSAQMPYLTAGTIMVFWGYGLHVRTTLQPIFGWSWGLIYSTIVGVFWVFVGVTGWGAI